jgi:tetratricopeptide (TPR) repeat protein
MRKPPLWLCAVVLAASLPTAAARAASPAEVKACDTGYPEEKKIAACTKIIENERESADVRIKAYIQRAYAHSYRKEAEAAYADAGEAIKLDPKRADTYDSRASIMASLGELDRVIADYSTAIDLQPSGNRYFQRGEIYRKKGDPDRARADFNKAVALLTAEIEAHPDSYWFYRSRSDAYRNIGEIDRALGDFAEFMKRRKSADYVQIADRGDLYLRKRDFDHAIADYTEAINKEPDDPERYARRALAYRLKGDSKRAIADYDKMVDTNASDPETYIGRGLAYAAAGKPERAVVDFTKAIDLFPESDTAYYDRGQAQRDSGNIDLAITDYSSAIERNPRYAVAFNSRGRAYFAKNDMARALADFDAAIQLNDKFAAAYCNRAILHQSQNRLDDAIRDFDRAIALDLRNKDFLLARASAFGAKDAHAEAEKDFTAVLVIDPVDAFAYVGRAAARLKQGAPAKALEDADRALAINKELAAVYRVRADIDAALGQTAKAAADREAAQKAQVKEDEKRRAANAARKIPPMRVTVAGEFPRAPASLKMNYKLGTVVEIRGDEITYKTPGLRAYRIASGDRLEEKFPGICSSKQTSNMGDRTVTASLDKYLVHIELQSRLDFQTGACRGRFNYYKENFLIDLSGGGCKFTYLQDRNLFGVGEFDTNILDQPCKAEAIR